MVRHTGVKLASMCALRFATSPSPVLMTILLACSWLWRHPPHTPPHTHTIDVSEHRSWEASPVALICIILYLFLPSFLQQLTPSDAHGARSVAVYDPLWRHCSLWEWSKLQVTKSLPLHPSHLCRCCVVTAWAPLPPTPLFPLPSNPRQPPTRYAGGDKGLSPTKPTSATDNSTEPCDVQTLISEPANSASLIPTHSKTFVSLWSRCFKFKDE